MDVMYRDIGDASASIDHELLADNFAGALAVIGLHFYQMA
jgi:hypothetical protein